MALRKTGKGGRNKKKREREKDQHLGNCKRKINPQKILGKDKMQGCHKYVDLRAGFLRGSSQSCPHPSYCKNQKVTTERSNKEIIGDLLTNIPLL